MSFSSLGLSEGLVRAVADQGYTVPTPIQLQAIPAVLAGGDLLAGAQTGTGKTAGFVLPMLERLSKAPVSRHGNARRPVRGLVLVPTRELAAQVEASIRAYGKHSPLTSMVLFGGVGLGPQTAQLRRGVDIVVATPGRLLDHHAQRNIDFSRIEVFVLDEADRMLDMGFIPDVRRVLAALPRQRQNLLFSATFSPEIKALAHDLLDNPRTIQVAAPNSTVEMIEQRVHPVNREDKSKVLAWLIGHHRWQQVLVFTRTKHGADKLARSLEGDGIRAAALHGNKSQNARTRALADFKAGRICALVATDIAARGIDIDQLPQVVNFDLPNVPEDYVHRIGRTGRAGAPGEAISLVCVDERTFLRDIERLIRLTLPQQVIEGFEPDPNAVAQPVFTQRGRRPGVVPPARTQQRRGADRGSGHGHGRHGGHAGGLPQGPHGARNGGSGQATPPRTRGNTSAHVRDGAFGHAAPHARKGGGRPRSDGRIGATPAAHSAKGKARY